MNKRIILLWKLLTLLNLVIKRRWYTFTPPLIHHLNLSLMWMTLLQFLLYFFNLLPHFWMFHFTTKTVPQMLGLLNHILITPKLYIEAIFSLYISTNTYRPCQLCPLEFMLDIVLKLLLKMPDVWLSQRLTAISLTARWWDWCTIERGIDFNLFILKVIYCQVNWIHYLSFLCHTGILG